MLTHFRGSLIFTLVALALGAWLGWTLTGTLAGTLGIVWICIVLSVLEVSLSLDNASVEGEKISTISSGRVS